ncbi:MAG: Crp/Fnr family transcriptional regulator [Bacteroidota bacterium]
MSDFLTKIGIDPQQHSADYQAIGDLVHPQSVAKGTVLQRAGDSVSNVFYVKKGLLRSYTIDGNGKIHIFMFAPEGWIIADSVMPDEPCELYIDALEHSEIEMIGKKPFDEALHVIGNSHDRSRNLFRRIRVLQHRVIMLMSASALERYDHFLAAYPDIIQRVPQKMVASYLGITPEALSKVKGDRARLQKKQTE